MHMIEVKGLQKAFGSEQVLKDVSFTVDKGETVAVIGYSGAGKSTMLRCLIDLEKADGGDVLIEGEPLIQTGGMQMIRRHGASAQRWGWCSKALTCFRI